MEQNKSKGTSTLDACWINLTDLNRKIPEKCELMSVEQDGNRMLVLAGELEQLFEQEDFVTRDRNRFYRQSRVVVPSQL